LGAVTPEQVKNEYFCNSLPVSILSMLLGKGGGRVEMKMSSLVKFLKNWYKSKRETFTHFTSLQQFSRIPENENFVKMWEYFRFSPFCVFRTSVTIFDFLNSLRVNTFRFPETFKG
jgi:hypothetical protein